MNQVTAWALILGAITPLLVSVVNQPRWTGLTRQLVMLGIALAVGLVNVIVQGLVIDWSLSFGNVLVILASVVGATQAAYTVLWKPTGIAGKVEAATSKGDAGNELRPVA